MMTQFSRNLRRAAAALLVATACAPFPPPAATGGGGDALAGTLTVFAAASLTESFDELAADFRAAHPSVTTRLSYGGSPTLVAQISSGAGADVFASADTANMQKLVDAGLVSGDVTIFAKNRLEIVVRAGNPSGIHGLADLARPDVVLVLAGASVPAGAYALQALAKAGVTATPRSLETDVRLVVAKVALGEADAGIVYRTDVQAGGPKIEGVDIPDRYNVTASYPIAMVKGTHNAAAASAFIAFLRSETGRAVLSRHGFIVP